MSDEKPDKDIEAGHPATGEGTAEERRVAARRRFLRQGTAAGSGVLIYTIHHNRSFAGTKKVIASSVAACESRGGTDAKKTKVVDSVNPVQKTKYNKVTGTYDPVFDKDNNPVYEKTKEAFECKVKI
jgi:hypothetical protein